MSTTVTTLVFVALFAVCLAVEPVLTVDSINNSPPAATEDSTDPSSGHGTFSTANIIGMFLAAISLIAVIIIFIAAAHFGKREIEKEQEMVVKKQKEEEEKYERARVYEMTRIGV